MDVAGVIAQAEAGGANIGVTNDVGFVVTEHGPVIMAIFCEDQADPHKGERIIGDIAQALLGRSA